MASFGGPGKSVRLPASLPLCTFGDEAPAPPTARRYGVLDALSFISHRLTSSDIEPTVVELGDEVLYIRSM